MSLIIDLIGQRSPVKSDWCVSIRLLLAKRPWSVVNKALYCLSVLFKPFTEVNYLLEICIEAVFQGVCHLCKGGFCLLLLACSH